MFTAADKDIAPIFLREEATCSSADRNRKPRLAARGLDRPLLSAVTQVVSCNCIVSNDPGFKL